MLSVAEVKKIINDPTIDDAQVEAIRDGFHQLAEMIFEDWNDKRKQNDDEKPQHCSAAH
jgi:hypothetical protein